MEATRDDIEGLFELQRIDLEIKRLSKELDELPQRGIIVAARDKKTAIEAKSEQVAELKGRFPGLKIMQALPVLAGVPIEEQKVLDYVRSYEGVSDFFLIDTKAVDAEDIGATGLTHDRSIDRAIVESTDVPCIIAGGLDEKNVADAIHETHPYGVDSFTCTNYADERANTLRCKDPEKVEAFVKAAKNA